MRTALFMLATLALLTQPCAYAGGGHAHDHHGHEAPEPAKGPHGGRLLVEGDFALEVTIFESGVPPQFRVFAYHGDAPLDASEVKVSITLLRFGGKKDEFALSAHGEFLTSIDTVAEPHSFDVEVRAAYRGRAFEWRYQSHEGRTELSSEALKIANVSIQAAGPAQIASVTHVYGRLLPNQDRVAHIIPRFPGIVKAIKKELGERVDKGEVLALIESNQSLQPYEVRSQIAGEVLARHATAGEFVSDADEIFVVGDLSEIWADFQVYRDDFEQIEPGQVITVDLGRGRELEAKVRYVAPLVDEATQSKLVRAVIPNPDGRLRPGLFVSGTLASAHAAVPLAVTREAIQTFRDWEVVYLTDGHVFQAMPVELGRRDTKHVEVLSGISSGDRYVARNSFIIKADIEKAGASHDH